MTIVKRSITFVVFLAAFALVANAGIIGNWSGSGRSWNNPDMATMKALAIAEGHTVLADGDMNAAALAGMTHFLVGEAGAAPSAGDLADLGAWVNAGGILLVMFDSGCSGCTGNNAILSGLGTGMSGSGSASNAPLVGGNFASTTPYNLVGQSIADTPGTAIGGGTALGGSYVHYASVGAGTVFAFADRSDHQVFAPSTSNVNGKLFLNILAGGASVPGGDVPEPSTAVLVVLGIAGLAVARRRR